MAIALKELLRTCNKYCPHNWKIFAFINRLRVQFSTLRNNFANMCLFKLIHIWNAIEAQSQCGFHTWWREIGYLCKGNMGKQDQCTVLWTMHEMTLSGNGVNTVIELVCYISNCILSLIQAKLVLTWHGVFFIVYRKVCSIVDVCVAHKMQL